MIKKGADEKQALLYNPIQADVSFTENSLGGGPGTPPPSVFLLWYKSITFNTLLESLVLNFNNLEKKIKYLLQYQVIKLKMCKNEKCAKYDKLYIIEKPNTANSKMQKYLKIFKN